MRFPQDFGTRTCVLGRLYMLNNQVVKFVRTSPKGFNFLNIETNKCVLRKAAFCRKYRNKLMDESKWKFKVTIPLWVVTTLKEIKTDD